MKSPTEVDTGQLRLQMSLDLMPPALAAAGVGVWDYDAVTDRVIGNEAAIRLYDLPKAARRKGVPLARLAAGIHQDDRRPYLGRVSGLRMHGGPIEAQYRTLPTGGDVVDVLVRGGCELDAEGRVVRASGLVLNLSNRESHAGLTTTALVQSGALDDALAALTLAADYAVAAVKVIKGLGPLASPKLRKSADAFLMQLGYAIAAQMSAQPTRRRWH